MAGLVDIQDGVCHFDDGSTLPLPEYLGVEALAGVAAWRVSVDDRHGIAFPRGARRADVEPIVAHLGKMAARHAPDAPLIVENL